MAQAERAGDRRRREPRARASRPVAATATAADEPAGELDDLDLGAEPAPSPARAAAAAESPGASEPPSASEPASSEPINLDEIVIEIDD